MDQEGDTVTESPRAQKPKLWDRSSRRMSSVEKSDTSEGRKVQKSISGEIPRSASVTEFSDSSWEIVDADQDSEIQRMCKCDPLSPDSIIFQTTAIAPEMKNMNGAIILTNEAVFFAGKQAKPSVMLRIAWSNITDFSKIRKKGLDKAMKIATENDSITLSSIKDRDSLLFFMKLVSDSRNEVRTFGFSQKEDAEVATRIVPLRAPHVVESVVKKNMSDIVAAVRDESTFHAMLAASGCKDIVISQWTKTKNGIQRNVQYVLSTAPRADVSSVQRFMKSGNVCVIESTDVFTRATMGKFLESTSQFYFKEKEETVNMRGALSIDWRVDTWDKEFLDAAILRVNRIKFNYMKSLFNEENFDVAKFNGQWRKHMPYVLVIGSLVAALLALLLMPDDTDWYKLGAGLVVVVFFFIM